MGVSRDRYVVLGRIHFECTNDRCETLIDVCSVQREVALKPGSYLFCPDCKTDHLYFCAEIWSTDEVRNGYLAYDKKERPVAWGRDQEEAIHLLLEQGYEYARTERVSERPSASRAGK